MEKNVINFIQRYYTFEINSSKEIFLRDVFEDNTETHTVDINSRVKFVWGRAKNVTGVDLRNKEFTHIQKIIREVFRSKQSIDFYNFMVNEIHEQEEWGGIVIPLKDLQCEFPNLYGNNLGKIITENINKDE